MKEKELTSLFVLGASTTSLRLSLCLSVCVCVSLSLSLLELARIYPSHVSNRGAPIACERHFLSLPPSGIKRAPEEKKREETKSERDGRMSKWHPREKRSIVPTWERRRTKPNGGGGGDRGGGNDEGPPTLDDRGRLKAAADARKIRQ